MERRQTIINETNSFNNQKNDIISKIRLFLLQMLQNKHKKEIWKYIVGYGERLLYILHDNVRLSDYSKRQWTADALLPNPVITMRLK